MEPATPLIDAPRGVEARLRPLAELAAVDDEHGIRVAVERGPAAAAAPAPGAGGRQCRWQRSTRQGERRRRTHLVEPAAAGRHRAALPRRATSIAGRRGLQRGRRLSRRDAHDRARLGRDRSAERAVGLERGVLPNRSVKSSGLPSSSTQSAWASISANAPRPGRRCRAGFPCRAPARPRDLQRVQRARPAA